MIKSSFGFPIKVMGASFSYSNGTVALRQIDSLIYPGTVVAFTGPNGSGKTTLARLINGILVPTRGKIMVGNMDTALVAASLVATRVGYVFQNPRRQFFASTVEEEVAFGPRNLGLNNEVVAQICQEVLEEMDLTARLTSHPYELNQSESLRLAMASVLAMHTPVIIFDEPTAFFDSVDYCRFLRVLERLKAQGSTVIVITHDMDFVADHCDRMLILKGGRLIADGTPEAVFSGSLAPELEKPCVMRIGDSLGVEHSIGTTADLVAYLQEQKKKKTKEGKA